MGMHILHFLTCKLLHNYDKNIVCFYKALAFCCLLHVLFVYFSWNSHSYDFQHCPKPTLILSLVCFVGTTIMAIESVGLPLEPLTSLL